MKFDFYDHDTSHRFSYILRSLKAESGRALYDDSFEQWLWAEYEIKQLHDNENFPDHLTGVEMSEETYTMILIKVNA